MKCAVFGARGRMGRMVLEEASVAGVEITGEYDAGSILLLPPDTQAVIDFSVPEAWEDLNRLLEGTPAALVSGTTGLDPACRSRLADWARNRAVFHSPNMSFGVFVLGRLVREARALLGDDFDLEIVDIHHRHKADSPSGTVLGLLEGEKGPRVHGRAGRPGPRSPGEIGIHSLRGGDVCGEHQVHLLGNGERLCITHAATGRRVFALGALRAARFVASMPPGLYGMEDLPVAHS